LFAQGLCSDEVLQKIGRAARASAAPTLWYYPEQQQRRRCRREEESMGRYVLVHGAWHGAWCWEKVVPLLEAKGHTVEAIDLPGHGHDQTPVAEATLDAYAERICRALTARPEPAVLVGHSLGGIAITQAAEDCPEQIQVLVYLTAFLLRDGESRLQVGQAPEAADSLTMRNLVIAEDRRSMTVRTDVLKDAFYGDCSDGDAARAMSLLVPESMAPGATPVHTTAERFGRIPRVYIECLRDRSIPLALQQRMYRAVPCQEIISLDTSHSPFYSAPEELANQLDRIGATPAPGA
jgi:pimeloyl-ACP methyl ester carboxylesterase